MVVAILSQNRLPWAMMYRFNHHDDNQGMADFIEQSWIKTSEYPSNFLPAGSIAINQASEDGECTVKGFYDPATGEYHIQEVVHNGCNNAARNESR